MRQEYSDRKRQHSVAVRCFAGDIPIGIYVDADSAAESGEDGARQSAGSPAFTKIRE